MPRYGFLTLRVSLVLFFLNSFNFLYASGISYSYGKLNGSFDWYTDSKYKDMKVNVHEFLLNDSSGELSASLQTMSNRVAAQAGAENEEREKVAKGESLGGPKTLSYSWRQEVAQEGDMKVYGLRLGSTDNAFSMDPISHNKSKDGLITYVEASLLANISQSELVENENYVLKGLWNFGGRFGGINSNDFSRTDNKEKTLSAAYLYLPLTYQLKFQSSFNLEFWGEYGGDVITLMRHYISKAKKKIPLDVYFGAGVAYRIAGVTTVGVKMERYNGSLVTAWGEPTINPTYTHQLTSVFVALGF